MEHLEVMARDDAFAGVLAVFISNIASGDVPPETADYFASATLVALVKKNEEDIYALRELHGLGLRASHSSPRHDMRLRQAGI